MIGPPMDTDSITIYDIPEVTGCSVPSELTSAYPLLLFESWISASERLLKS